MLLKPAEVPFLSAKKLTGEEPLPPNCKVLCGVPYEKTESFRDGSGLAPTAIREFSYSMESYSIITYKDLENINFYDLGDLDVSHLQPEEMVNEVESLLHSLPYVFPFLLGGEHTITLGAVRALIKRYPQLFVVSLDAHPDFRPSYEGQFLSHATVMKRISELVGKERLLFLGLRTSTPEEWEELKDCYLVSSDPVALPQELRNNPLYISLDIDVLDPSCAPGTGNPEPGGWSFKELMNFLLSLQGYNVVGMDIVEVSPPLDSSGITIASAVKLVREALLLF